MLSKINSAAVVGLEALPITVEVDVSSGGLPAFQIVGLPDKAVEEAKERVRSALKNSGADFPAKRITVNLAPADLPKEGPAYDLPIALGILIASGQLAADLSDALVFGELSLDGDLRRIRGALSKALMAKDRGFKKIFSPTDNAQEVAVVSGVEIYPIKNLVSLYKHLAGEEKIDIFRKINFEDLLTDDEESEFDLSEIKGQEMAKRALEIAAAGGHNILFSGPPGAGKTLLARTIPSIMPSLTFEEALEVTKIYSVSGLLGNNEPIVQKRPFRSPHHTISHIGMVGGGQSPKPGEISLAHRGVLFLDEFPEFPRQVMEALRQPMEDGHITVSRASGTLKFPAKFILIAAKNPCPCGFFGDPKKECVCTSAQIIKYHKRISGPILDRIDIHLEVPAVEVPKLVAEEKLAKVGKSKMVREKVKRTRAIQKKRFSARKIFTNAEMNQKDLREFCRIGGEEKAMLSSAIEKLGMSARAYTRVLKLSRTIADLEENPYIKLEHIAEALQYRPKNE